MLQHPVLLQAALEGRLRHPGSGDQLLWRWISEHPRYRYSSNRICTYILRSRWLRTYVSRERQLLREDV
ncbi:hypothetical protein F441_00311 [Phytophthora nicotianae CJ01A1]|uniref:Uncharacterized protein n=3 Tax=Phytophthora nicotianae TaxID=4792 RepID=W2JVT3_PHYNI|nr:hypothetical protein L915_00296 [Phytophthora nicotianae]ETL50471.1 hypothetical protein L916_00295 [Phytophthora nicotianae]ETO86106.1 hypothetical protein F444_00316 [Phytophthora nicotianae P1976]ETP27145.1 hypothetical protein F441_00311 [Phytophthora nicotianae CJ01A1]